MSDDPLSFLPFLGELADAARLHSLAAAGAIAFEDKGGGAFDPVTRVDRATEAAIRALIAERHPDHGIAGEEYGIGGGGSRWSWSIDPIDGTRQLICGLPLWTTLIALLDRGRPLLGLIDAPRIGERYVGWGGGAVLRSAAGERALAASGCAELGRARLSTTDPFAFDEGGAAAFRRLERSVLVTRYGCDGYAYARLAAGSLDLVAERGLKPHDIHALVPVVVGAGAVIGNWSGGADLSGGDVLAAATRPLYDRAVELLG